MTQVLPEKSIENQLISTTSLFLTESGQPFQRQITMQLSLQRHLGIDSLGRAELFHRIEKQFSVNLPDKLLAQAETLEDIAVFLRGVKPEYSKVKDNFHTYLHGERSTVDPSQYATLTALLAAYAEQSPHKPHVYFQHDNGQEEIIRYGHLYQQSLRVAQSLKILGLKEGETVAIMLPTHPNFFYTFFGVLLAGGIPVPIYPPFRRHMLEVYAHTEERILRNAQVRMLVTFEQAEKLSRLLKNFIPSLQHVICADDLLKTDTLSTPAQAKTTHFAFIQYTSGSTSDPKGVLLTHANLLANIRAYGKGIAVNPDDIAVSWLPLYHDMGLIGMWLGSLYYGIPLVLLTPFAFLNHPERWLWVMHYYRGTISGAPNFAYDLCVRKVDPALLEGLDLSAWRIAANGAEKIYPATLEQFCKKFATYGFQRTTMLPVYGLAESTVCVTIPPLGREFWVDQVDRQQFENHRLAIPATGEATLKFVACGLPIEGHKICIMDENNEYLPERHVGRLHFRGPSSMQGYFNNPQATSAIFHDGWYDSGDLAYIANGEVFITGRQKDLIIKAGRNIYPVEVEETVASVAGVRQGCVAVFSVTEETAFNEQLIVVAETREKNANKKAKIIDEIKHVIVAHLDIVPDQVILVAPHTVPKTSSGKLQRAACKKMYLANELTKAHTPVWLQITKLTFASISRRLLLLGKKSLKFIYTIYVTLLILLMAPFMYLIVSVSTRHFAARICRYFARFLLFAMFSPLKVLGKENLTWTSPMIYAANHASYIDTFVIWAIMPPNTRLVAKKELLNAPFLRTFMRKLDYIAIDRADLIKGLADTEKIKTVLQQQDSILIFPEGTFGYAAGLRPFRFGAFKTAAEANVPVCPVAIQGTRYILRDGEILMQPQRITVTVEKPIQAAGNTWHDATALRLAVRQAIAEHCGEPSLDFIAAQTIAPSKPQEE